MSGVYRTPEYWEREKALQRIRRAATRDPAAHAAEMRARYWKAKGLAVPPKHVPREAAPVVPLIPVPSCPAGHEVYEAARDALLSFERAELGSDMDSGAADLLQEYALAVVAGHDPLAAIRLARSRMYHDRRSLVHGLALVDDLKR